MESLRVKRTENTFSANCDADTGTIELAGSSYPECAIDFFQPIYDWTRKYIHDVSKNIVINLKIYYLNSSSSKCMLDLFEILEEYYSKGGSVQVNWYYQRDDEDILDTGREFAEDIDLPFNYIGM